MKALEQYKTIIAAVVIFILAMTVYSLFFKDPPLVDVPSEVAASSVGNDLISLLAELQAVNFDSSIFTSPGYLLLTDFTAEIPVQPTGRPNPFSLIGRD